MAGGWAHRMHPSRQPPFPLPPGGGSRGHLPAGKQAAVGVSLRAIPPLLGWRRRVAAGWGAGACCGLLPVHRPAEPGEGLKRKALLSSRAAPAAELQRGSLKFKPPLSRLAGKDRHPRHPAGGWGGVPVTTTPLGAPPPQKSCLWHWRSQCWI